MKDRIFSAFFGQIVSLRTIVNVSPIIVYFSPMIVYFSQDRVLLVMIVYISTQSQSTPKHIFRVKTGFWFRRNSLISYEFKKSIFSYLKRFEITDKSYECKNVTKPQKYYILIIFWRFDITKYTFKWNKLVRKRSFWARIFVKFS